LKKGKAIIVQNVEEAKTVQIENDQKLAIATQTTLSLDDTKEIIEILEARFPVLKGNVKNDICYATQNRQTAVYDLIQNYQIDGLIVVGSQNSSNSNRLKDIGTQRGIPSFLINEPDELDLKNVLNLKKIGITAGASAPEHLIEKLVDFFKKKDNNLKITIMDGVKEDTVFHLPKQLRD
jgi:4-hydroxy-3-methylbut-2-enyl diphosphate reductase